LTRYLQRFVAPNATVVDVGAGYCGFVNSVDAGRRIAIDIDERLPERAAPGVETVVADATNGLRQLPSGSVDVIFASNFLEHLPMEAITAFLSDVRRVLKPGASLLLLQPNFRKCAKNYFDDYTHVSIHSDRSLPDLLSSHAFRVTHVDPGLMPLTVKSKAGRLAFLTPFYLRLPWRPLARQMLVIAQLPETGGRVDV
jgi:ubiquinone/menaquinone biosynthesis C-methylase UbiE